MLHLSEGLLLSLSIGCSISMRHVLLFHVSMTVESRVANTCVCTVHSHLVYLGDDSFVSTLLNSSLYAQHIVRPNKPQHRSLEQERFIEEPSKENGQLTLKQSELPNGFQRRVFKGNIRCESCSMCYSLMEFLFLGWWC